jgi:predicted nucleic acid-binding protein
MITYWDSSALVQSVYDPGIKARFEREGGLTRTHSLAEVFSALTANPVTRLDADSASRIVGILSIRLEFVDLTAGEVVAGLRQARRRGVRGGRVHDFLHALAAEKGHATTILTLDQHDFDDLTPVPIEQA